MRPCHFSTHFLFYMYDLKAEQITYDHRLRRTGHPVRSAIHKPQIGRSVVEWVTISESLLLYVFCFFSLYSLGCCVESCGC